MKNVIIAMAMLAGSSVFAAGAASYGPGATDAAKVVCYQNSGSDAKDCHTMNYRYFAPRTVKVCGGEGKSDKTVCRYQTASGNWTSRKMTVAEQRAEDQARSGKGGN